jgi:hypothetical protein
MSQAAATGGTSSVRNWVDRARARRGKVNAAVMKDAMPFEMRRLGMGGVRGDGGVAMGDLEQKMRWQYDAWRFTADVLPPERREVWMRMRRWET